MMRYNMNMLQTMAIAFSYLVIVLPVAGATNVNIIFNGVVQETTDISPENAVNVQVVPLCNSDDPNCNNAKVQVVISSASLSHSISKIFLFKCKPQDYKLQDPSSCSQEIPLRFDSFANEELLWSDVGGQESAGEFYPQTGSLMTIVKLEDSSGQTSWVGNWHTIKRTKFDAFTVFNFDLTEIDFFVTSDTFIDPVKNFITNFQMLPFNWASKVVFKTANSLYAVGGDEQEMETPHMTSANPSGDEIVSINKDFFLVFSETTSGVSAPITLNQNPSFTCGDNICDSNLGESSVSCCTDCDCDSGYCDTTGDPETGVCKDDDNIALSITSPSITAKDCMAPIQVDLPVQVINPPSSLPTTISGIATLEDSSQTVSCSGDGVFYSCPLRVQSPISCGASSMLIGPNTLNMTLIYNDGLNQKTKVLSEGFDSIPITLSCSCQEGFFCDSGTFTCKSEASLTVSVTEVETFLENFDAAGDSISLTAKINNPPSDLAVSGVTYTLGILYKDSSEILNSTTGSITCTLLEDHEYSCEIPISISSYDHTSAYFFRGNSIAFSVQFSDVGSTVTKDLTSAFADITIPSFQCGDGVCNAEESQSTCCTDCGCPQDGMYCDINRQNCGELDDIVLDILTVDPVELTDCSPPIPHVIDIGAQVQSPPSDLSLDFVFYLENNIVQTHLMACSPVNFGADSGLFSCDLTLAELPGCQEQADGFVLGPNTLNMTISFSDGASGKLGKTLSAGFEDMSVTPTYTSGDGICETHLGESALNSCIDCPCKDELGDSYFCSVSDPTDPGTCINTDDIKLVIDSPTSLVTFDSCEVTQSLDIKAHVENMPDGLVSQIFSATLGGENAELFYCSSSGQYTGGNISAPIECRLGIPPSQTCSLKDPTTIYEGNSISLTMVFQSGLGSTEIHTSTAQLPEIKVTQQIRSIFDITQEAMAKMEREMHKTMQIAEDLLGWIETCFNVAILLVIVSLVAIVAGGVAGAKSDDATWADGVEAGATAGSALLNSWTTLCNMLTKMHEALLQVQQIRMKIIQSEFCMDIVQHQMDSGMCEMQEDSCFMQTVSCLNYLGDIDNIMSGLSSTMNEFTAASNQFGQSLTDFGEGLGDFDDLFGGGGGRATFNVLWNGGPLVNGTKACNRMSGQQTRYNPTLCGGKGNQDDLNIHVMVKSNCEFPIILAGASSVICSGISGCQNHMMNIDTLPTQNIQFTLYCFNDQDHYVTNANNLDIMAGGTYENEKQFTVELLADPDGCDCGLSGVAGGGGSGGGIGLVTLIANPDSITSGESIQFTATVDAASTFNPPFIFKFDFNGDNVPDSGASSGIHNLDVYTVTKSFESVTDTTVDVTVFVEDVDASGNVRETLDPATVTITVTGSGSGSAAPTVDDDLTTPQPGSTQTEPVTSITVTYDQDMDPTIPTVAIEDSSRISYSGGSKSSSISYVQSIVWTASRKLTIIPNAPLGDEEYDVTITGAKSVSGDLQEPDPYALSFTVDTSGGVNVAPTVEITSPLNGDIVSGTIPVEVTVTDSDSSSVDVMFYADGFIGYSDTITLTGGTGSFDLNLNTDPYLSGTPIELEATADDGTSTSSHKINIFGSSVTVKSTEPDNRDTGVDRSADWVITFPEKMDTSRVEVTNTVTSEKYVSSGLFSTAWSSGDTILTISPPGEWLGDSYSLSVFGETDSGTYFLVYKFSFTMES